MAEAKRFRIGMDSGGTFTDVVLIDTESSEWSLDKTLSDKEDPRSVLHSGLGKAAAAQGMTVEELVASTEMVVLGTTVATNAVLQHRGAKVGLLTTAGHHDSLEIREGHKEDGHRYDWEYPPAQMLVPRSRRFPIRGRILWDGSEKSPLSVEDVEEAAARFEEEGVEAVGISFLWSFQNPEHEERAAEIVRSRLPGVYLTTSHDLLPMIGDYSRVSTIALNAFVAPVVRRFVEGMEAALVDLGFTGPVRYFQANGGMSSGKSLVPKAIYALNSGPAAAPTAGAFYGDLFDRDVITIDAGGTSLDIGLVRGSETDLRLSSDVARYRIGIPMVNIETLGAGGGSIAWLDDRGLLAVGPQSAEARPGPACYGFGGDKPTVTDALVALGWFSQTVLLGGEMPIDAAAARAAIADRVGEPLGLDVDQAAEGIIRIAAENMVGGIRRVSIERGYDPRDAVLVAVGGSGPAFACRIARELEMSTVVVPRVASGFCAFGAAVADVKHDYVATYTVKLHEADLDRLNGVFDDLEQRGRAELESEGVAPDQIVSRRAVEMRYVDQVHNCLVSVPLTGTIDDAGRGVIRKAFDQRHEELYTYSEPWNQALLVNVHCSVGARAADGESLPRPASTTTPRTAEADSERSIYSGPSQRRVHARVLTGEQAASAGEVQGPAVIEETTTTIVVEEGWSARLDDRGFYELSHARALDGAPAARATAAAG
ncbi:MAG: hydantoinase/oxoprolinase family protein [Actinomycetota bacterium]|nr:hydantoinase/oxoprolinase family protein [Actinomycetota bacterium]